MKRLEYILPHSIKQEILSDGFYVKMNRHYTATVRRLQDMIDYINEGDIDENFGEITSESSTASPEYVGALYDIIAKVKGFASFNQNKHQFVELSNQKETVSIKLASGKQITVAVMENAGCVDICYHNGEKTVQGNSKFKIMGFDEGGTPVKSTPVTLATILLK
jgi:hypothetical protein